MIFGEAELDSEAEGGECRPEPEQIIVDDPETYHQL